MGKTEKQHRVIPLRHGFVALHPKPKGIIHLIGGYFFGTGVNFWYNGLIDALKQRYTVHAYSYSFAQLSHWKLAHDLLEQIEHVKRYGADEAERSGYESQAYDNPSQHCLVGHSLGCECIALIRFLGLSKARQRQLLEQARQRLGPQEVKPQDLADIEELSEVKAVPYKTSLLMAPCFKTPASIASFLDVRPKQKLMRYLIEQEPSLLPRVSLISFQKDTIAQADVDWIHPTLLHQGSLVNAQEISVSRKCGTALFYHMIPAFDPVNSGLASCATDFIEGLINPKMTNEVPISSGSAKNTA